MVHMHYTQPLKIKFGTNHFFGSETLVPIQYREHVNDIIILKRLLQCAINPQTA